MEEAIRKKRNDFIEAEVIVLEEAWHEGMTSAGAKCQSMITKVAQTLNVDEQRVKSWIGNRRAKDKGVPGCRTKTKPTNKSGPNAYSLFVSKQIRGNVDGKTFLKETAQKWNAASEEEKAKYKTDALEIRNKGNKGMKRDDIIKHQLNIVSNACLVLEEQGFEIGGLGFDPTSESRPAIFGSSNALNFFCNKREEFERKMCASFPKIKKEEVDNRKELRLAVQRKFQSCWESATGLTTLVPYLAVEKKKINLDVTGLPVGIRFQNPSNYGKTAMKDILHSSVKFRVNANQARLVEASIQSQEKVEGEIQTDSEESDALNNEMISSIIQYQAVLDPIILQEKRSESEEIVELAE